MILRIQATEAPIDTRANPMVKIVGRRNANLKRDGKNLIGKSTGDPKRQRGHQPPKKEAATKAPQAKKTTRLDVESTGNAFMNLVQVHVLSAVRMPQADRIDPFPPPPIPALNRLLIIRRMSKSPSDKPFLHRWHPRKNGKPETILLQR